jgi:hypothetical protein
MQTNCQARDTLYPFASAMEFDKRLPQSYITDEEKGEQVIDQVCILTPCELALFILLFHICYLLRGKARKCEIL